MTVSDIQAIAAPARLAMTAAAWTWHVSRKIWGWRKQRARVREQRDAVLDVVIPACAITLAIGLILARRIGNG